VLNTSDLPGGVVNILTGFEKELVPHFSLHMDVNGILYGRNSTGQIKTIQENSAENLKRVTLLDQTNWNSPEAQNPYLILDHQEIKTTWHPIGY